MIKVQGNVAYELLHGVSTPLTDSQADGLIEEYKKLGITYKKSIYKGNVCVFTKSPADDYVLFKEKLSDCWEEIRNRVGYSLLSSTANTYRPGVTSFIPGEDWYDVKAFIDNNYIYFDVQEDLVDIDGNVYKTIKIGNQIWMAENLKVAKYNDGIPIEFEHEEEYKILVFFKTKRFVSWETLGKRKKGAYCLYENNILNKDKYGALYNWYAVDTKKLAPKGWHIPSDKEWDELIDYLGGFEIAGKFLKSDVGWEENGNNKSGFTALPGGSRDGSGAFHNIGFNGGWWSATEYDAALAWSRSIFYSDCGVYRGNHLKEVWSSVRCVRD